MTRSVRADKAQRGQVVVVNGEFLGSRFVSRLGDVDDDELKVLVVLREGDEVAKDRLARPTPRGDKGEQDGGAFVKQLLHLQD